MKTLEDLDARTFISDRDLAARYGVRRSAVRHWAFSGLVAHIRLPGTGGYLVDLAEAQAILLEGFAEAGVTEAARQAECDPIQIFLKIHTEPCEDRVTFMGIYRAYLDWAAGEGLPKVTKHRFGRVLNGLKFSTLKLNSLVYKTGLRMLSPEEVAERSRLSGEGGVSAGDSPALAG